MPTNPATPDNPLLAHAGSDMFSSAKSGFAFARLLNAHRALLATLTLTRAPRLPAALRADLARQEQTLRETLIHIYEAEAADDDAAVRRCAAQPTLADIAVRASARAAEARAAAQALRDAAPAQAAAP